MDGVALESPGVPASLQLRVKLLCSAYDSSSTVVAAIVTMSPSPFLALPIFRSHANNLPTSALFLSPTWFC